MKKRDYITMAAITLVFAVLVFYRLGGTTMPQSSYTVTRENPTVILDFGETVTLEYFAVYFGPQSFLCDLYQREEEDGEWELIESDAFSIEAYKWKGFFKSPHQLRYLRLEFKEAFCHFYEMLFVDQTGQLIVPANAGAYPDLFDEQGLFDPYLSKTYYNEPIFDETFYIRTAYEYTHGLTAYENTHPPLGKSLVALGIRLFGLNPFGWRSMSAVFGIMMVPLMYAFAWAIFGNRFAATAAAVLLAFDCMHFTLSRIATIDVFAGFFILLMYYLFYRFWQTDQASQRTFSLGKKLTLPYSYIPLGLCGLTMGLGVATKWTGVFAGLGLGVLFLIYIIKHHPAQRGRLLAFCTVFFVVLPLFIYILSHRPVVLDPPANGLLQTFTASTARILSWHTGIDDTHDFGSRFYTWPFDWRHLHYISVPLEGNYWSSVNLMGNPAIWWFGLPSLVFCLYRWVKKKDEKAGFIAVAYLAQYLPWFFIGRLTFIYHYYPAALFMILAAGYTLDEIRQAKTWGKTAVYGYLAVAVAVFVIFYPVISGSPITPLYESGLRWLPRWEFC
jgi:dolichyl-phosphate-mannose--protein O-mannosyl transferase